jgi:Domain of unknown function (DUF4160)
MPTLLRWRGYRFFFYSADRWEPPHVHIYKNGREAKIWLHDISIAVNFGYPAGELNEIVRATRQHRDVFMEAWNDHFGR